MTICSICFKFHMDMFYFVVCILKSFHLILELVWVFSSCCFSTAGENPFYWKRVIRSFLPKEKAFNYTFNSCLNIIYRTLLVHEENINRIIVLLLEYIVSVPTFHFLYNAICIKFCSLDAVYFILRPTVSIHMISSIIQSPFLSLKSFFQLI